MVILSYLCILPRMMVIFKKDSIFCVNVRRSTRINMQHLQVVNATEYVTLLIIENLFVTHQSYSFLW